MQNASTTIADVKRELANFEAAADKDKHLEAKYAKKLWLVVDNLTIKDGVTKDLNQAYTNGEKWWAVNVMKGDKEGCNKDNKDEKVKARVLKSDAWAKHHGNPDTEEKAEKWLADKFKD